MTDAYPFVSIVTPSYNQAAYLEQTIQSVLTQDYPRFEYLVIDGGSTDGSADVIHRYADRLAYWVSKPDQGQADAINKGLSRARGELLTWLNSDDLLLPGALQAAADAFRRQPEALLLSDAVHFDADAGLAFLVPQNNVTLENLIMHWRPGWRWNQPGTFAPSRWWRRIGPMDINLRYVFDRDWMCRLLAEGMPTVYLRRPLAAFRMHANSKTMGEGLNWDGEQLTVSKRYARLLPGLSEAQIEAGQHMMQAILQLSFLFVQNWNGVQARRHLLTAARQWPKTQKSGQYWRFWLRSWMPMPVVRLIRLYWLNKHRQTAAWDLLPA